MKGLNPEDRKEYDYATKQAWKVFRTIAVIIVLVLASLIYSKL